MDFLKKRCRPYIMNDDIVAHCYTFNCGDADLDDFFRKDTSNYERQLLGKSFCFRLNEDPEIIVCAYTLSCSGLDVKHLPGSRRKKLTEAIPREKHFRTYPAVLIGRLAVNQEFSGKGIGTELITVIQGWALDSDNRFACRFLTVDAYNSEATRRFYERNGFIYLFSSEQQERDYIGMTAEQTLHSRLMYFDLMRTFTSEK